MQRSGVARAAEHRELWGRPLESWIGMTLLIGVGLAAALILAGLLRLLFGSDSLAEPATVASVIDQELHPTSLVAILDGVGDGRPTSLIRLGIFVLILTPAARVGLTLVVFLVQRDWIFVGLTAIVLLLLLLGIVGVGA